MTAVATGRLATCEPMPAQIRDSSRPEAPNRGMRGQKAPRSVTSSSAGRNVVCASGADQMA